MSPAETVARANIPGAGFDTDAPQASDANADQNTALPDSGRFGILPLQRGPDGKLHWAVPAAIHDPIMALWHAAQGESPDKREALGVAMSILGGGAAGSVGTKAPGARLAPPEAAPITPPPVRPAAPTTPEPVIAVPAGKPRVTPKAQPGPVEPRIHTQPDVPAAAGQVEPSIRSATTMPAPVEPPPARPGALMPDRTLPTEPALGREPEVAPDRPIAAPPTQPAKAPLEPAARAPVTLDDIENGHVATRVIESQTREGGTAEGNQQRGVNQVIQFKGPDAHIEANFFDAARDYQQPNADAAFNRLYTSLRLASPEFKVKHPEYFNADGAPLPKPTISEALNAGAVRFNDQVDTAMNNARRAAEQAGGRLSTKLLAPEMDAIPAMKVPGKPNLRGPAADVGEPPVVEPSAPPKIEPPEPSSPVGKNGPIEPPPKAAPDADMQAKLAEAKADYDSKVAFYKRSNFDDAMKQKGLKGAGMEYAAAQREITGNLTAKEAAAKAKREASNYVGKEVFMDGHSGTGVVQGNSYGKVRVKLEDGTVKSFEPGQLIAKPKYGPGTLGAGPLIDPALIKKTVRDLGNFTGKAKGFANAIQNMPESADLAGAAVWKYGNRVAAAAEKAVMDRDLARRGGADGAFVEGAEKAERLDAKREMIGTLVDHGYLIYPGGDMPVPKGYVKSTGQFKDLELAPRGIPTQPWIRRDALPVVEQIVGAHDIAGQRKYASGPFGAWEAASHAAVTLPMLNPLFHGITTAGKAFPYVVPGVTRKSIMAYGKKAYQTLNDPAALNEQMKVGLKPWPKRDSMAATGAEMGNVEKAVRWMGDARDTAPGMEKTLRNLGFNKPYDFFRYLHNDVLGNMVNFMQQGAYHMRLEQQVAEHVKKTGEQPTAGQLNVFKAAAAKDSNKVGGNLPKGDVALWLHRLLGGTAFSRGLTASTAKQATNAIMGDRMIRAYAKSQGFTDAEATKIMQSNRDFMRNSLLLDYVVMHVVAQGANLSSTAYYNEPDKNGVEGPHFTWDNPGAAPGIGEKILPKRIFVAPELDDSGKRTGRSHTVGIPTRNTRDILEMMALPLHYATGTGDKPKLLQNKASVPVHVAQEIMSREDWAGRKLDGPADIATTAVSHVMPPLTGDLPKAALEAYRMGGEPGRTFFSDSVKKAFEPKNAALVLAGMQPQLSSIDPETTKAAGRHMDAETLIWDRARRLKQMLNSKEMSPESREAAANSVLDDADKANMDLRTRKALRKYLNREGPSKTQSKNAARQRDVEGGIEPPPTTPTIRPTAPGRNSITITGGGGS